MKTLLEIFEEGREINDIISDLKEKVVYVPKWLELEKEYDPKLHDIMTDSSIRKDKQRKDGTTDKAARITYGLQKLTVRRMTQMVCTIPIERIYRQKDDESTKEVISAIENIYKSVRIDSINNKRLKAFFAACELCTVWYITKSGDKHNKYGFETNKKIRCKSYSPMAEKYSGIECADLYPLFDKYGDLIAFSFEYKVNEAGQEVVYFETYTDSKKYCYRCVEGSEDWTEVESTDIKLLKIPISYIKRAVPIWEDTTTAVNEIELTMSRESDIIKKNSAPLIEVKGKLKLGDGVDTSNQVSREVYQLEGDGGVRYVTWEQQIEAMKWMVDTLKKNTEEELQLPNLSLENVKGLGAISGEARKTLLTDSHLKVGEEEGDIIEFLDREYSVIKSFLAVMKPEWGEILDTLICEHKITPFQMNDEGSTIDRLSKAAGNKAFISQETAAELSGLVSDPKAEVQKIANEEREQNSVSLFPSAV